MAAGARHICRRRRWPRRAARRRWLRRAADAPSPAVALIFFSPCCRAPVAPPCLAAPPAGDDLAATELHEDGTTRSLSRWWRSQSRSPSSRWWREEEPLVLAVQVLVAMVVRRGAVAVLFAVVVLGGGGLVVAGARGAQSEQRGRMDNNNSQSSKQCQGSRSQPGNPNFVFDINQTMTSMDQAYGSPYHQMSPHMSMVLHQGQHMPLPQFSPATYSPNALYRGPFPIQQPFINLEEGAGSHQHENEEGERDSNAMGAEEEVQEVDASHVPRQQVKKTGMARRGKAYDPEEDKVICAGWLNTTLDAVVGTNQDKAGFYKRLHMYYLENYDPNSKRSENSIQQRWSAINKAVSLFCAILGRIECAPESGKNHQDMVNDAIKEYQRKELWHFHHCWEVLHDEPKWNNRVLETTKAQGQKRAHEPAGGNRDTEPQPADTVSSPPSRPEGRDSVKRRNKSKMAETSSSSVAVDMLQKMHDRGQEMDEIDNKHKEEIMNLEKAKFELQQKQWHVKMEMMLEANKVQREHLELEKKKEDSKIMFTDVSKLGYPLREWVLKRQMEILARDGIDAGAASDITKDD